MRNQTISITVNGDTHDAIAGQTLAELVESLGLEDRRIAVEINEDLVPRSRFGEHELTGGDRIEIVHAIGGG